MVPLRLLSSCVSGMSIIGALESSSGFTWVCGTSDVIGSVVPVVWSGDATVGFGVCCSTACSDGVVTTGVLVSDFFLRWSACFLMRLISALQAFIMSPSTSSSVM